MKDINDFLLTASITVGETKEWISEKDDYSKKKLIILIRHRFINRYIKHLKVIDSGFLKMAVACLMIETLESFKQGLKDTKGKSERMFKDFFESEEALFPGFKDIYSDFYVSIRCGILHQAETTNGWRILRKSDLLDKENRAINSVKFVTALNRALNKYINALKSQEFDTEIWRHAIFKLEDICENCEIRK